jgi:hypothetical protein
VRGQCVGGSGRRRCYHCYHLGPRCTPSTAPSIAYSLHTDTAHKSSREHESLLNEAHEQTKKGVYIHLPTDRFLMMSSFTECKAAP